MKFGYNWLSGFLAVVPLIPEKIFTIKGHGGYVCHMTWTV